MSPLRPLPRRPACPAAPFSGTSKARTNSCSRTTPNASGWSSGVSSSPLLGTDPVDAVIAATEESLRDFLSRPELVLRRYKLTRVVPELRKREVIEHERYVALTRSYLRDHLPPDAPPFQPMALAALIDAIHRSALGNWVRERRPTDPVAELTAGMEWVRRLMVHQSTFSTAPLLLAVLPDTPQTRRVLTSLKDAAEELP